MQESGTVQYQGTDARSDFILLASSILIMKIAIVGGGPAGAHLGYCLAKEGIKATIFDHSHPREKPCGGGISALAMKKFAFLRDLYYESNDEWLKLISPKGRVALVGSEEETMAVSRKRMDMFILERARAAGANLVEERVVDFGRAKDGDEWVIKTDKRLFREEIAAIQELFFLLQEKVIMQKWQGLNG